ncbi:MAG: DUF368 domain-containing protein [Candidatus Paceibacteria bacterium]
MKNKQNQQGNKEDNSSLFLFLKGVAMGASDIIPGVSGGTMALITGIYERLIDSINKIKISEPIKTFDFRFFIPLGLGIISAVFLMADFLHYALNSFPAQTYAFFFGVILASAIFVFNQHIKTTDSNTAKIILVTMLGAVFAFLFVGLDPLSASSSLLILFLSAVVAISAMLLPGISGSFILLLLGQYEYVLNIVKKVPAEMLLVVQGKKDSLFAIIQALNLAELFVFAGGAILGLLLFSKIIGYLLDHRKNITMAFLVGLMLGALRKPYEEVIQAGISSSDILLSVVVSGFVGIALVFVLEKITEHNLVENE